MKKLKLEIVNLDNNDVIATSGSLCSFDLTGYYNTFTYSTYSDSPGKYEFLDSDSHNKKYGVDDYTFHFYDENGNNVTSSILNPGCIYHIKESGNECYVYLCKNSHPLSSLE